MSFSFSVEVVEDEADQNGENVEEKNDLRISQPKYSQLLKDLDFSQTRMVTSNCTKLFHLSYLQVDVTNLLSDEGGNYLTADENENPKKVSSDEKYESVSTTHSSASTDEAIGRPSSSNFDIDNDNLTDAANEIQNDLNNLAAILQEASQIPTEDDDTSKQATQNYDLNDIDEEVGFTFSQKIVLLFIRKISIRLQSNLRQ